MHPNSLERPIFSSKVSDPPRERVFEYGSEYGSNLSAIDDEETDAKA